MNVSIFESIARSSRVTVRQKETAVRRRQMVATRKAGLTYAAIGLKFGISGERVRQILNGIEQKHKTSTYSSSLRTGDVARLLRIHVNTVRRWANNGTLKPYRIGSRRDRRFKQEDIDGLYTET